MTEKNLDTYSKMLNSNDDNFDDIDLDELFNDFYENPQPALPKYDFKSQINQDDLIEFNENDCTAPRIIRKRIKTKQKNNNTKQKTMYDYASTISYKHQQFYSSLSNTTTTKTIIKGPKRSLTEHPKSSPSSKISKTNDFEDLSSTPPDLIDKLLKYLDERSRNTTEQKSLEKTEMKKKKMKPPI